MPRYLSVPCLIMGVLSIWALGAEATQLRTSLPVTAPAAQQSFSAVFSQAVVPTTPGAQGAAVGATGVPGFAPSMAERVRHLKTFLVIAFIFIGPLVIFRWMFANLESNIHKRLQPVLTCIYREMFTFTFVCTVCYMLHLSPMLTDLSIILLPSQPTDALALLYEDVNSIILLAAVFYFLLAVYLLSRAVGEMEQWGEFEKQRLSLTPRSYGRLANTCDRIQKRSYGWSLADRRQQAKDQKTLGLRAFMVLRQDFVSRQVTRCRAADQNFNFAEYLSGEFATQLAQVVSIPLSAWLLLAAAAIVLVAPSMLTSVMAKATCLVLFGYALVIPAAVQASKVQKLQQHLIRQLPLGYSLTARQVEENRAFLDSRMVDYPFMPPGTPFIRAKHSAGGAFRPAPGVHTAQDAVFWRGADGPAFLLAFNRMLLLLSAFYLALYLNVVGRKLSFQGPEAALSVALTLLGSLPPVVVTLVVSGVLAPIAVVTSIEFMQNVEGVDAVLAQALLLKFRNSQSLLLTLHCEAYHSQIREHAERQEVIMRNAGIDKEHLNAAFGAVIGEEDKHQEDVGLVQLQMLFTWLGLQLSRRQLVQLLGNRTNRVSCPEFVLMVSSVAGLAIDEMQVRALLRRSLPHTDGVGKAREVQEALTQKPFLLPTDAVVQLLHDYRQSVHPHAGAVGGIKPSLPVNVDQLSELLYAQVQNVNGFTDLPDSRYAEEGLGGAGGGGEEGEKQAAW